jgi:hypothetical protein
MSVKEILEELPKLKAEERFLLLERLNELEAGGLNETPELLAALDDAEKSLVKHGGTSIDVIRARLEAKWRTP